MLAATESPVFYVVGTLAEASFEAALCVVPSEATVVTT